MQVENRAIVKFCLDDSFRPCVQIKHKIKLALWVVLGLVLEFGLCWGYELGLEVFNVKTECKNRASVKCRLIDSLKYMLMIVEV